MSGFENNKILKSLEKFGQSLGQNKFLSSLQAGMMSLMGAIMVGAICQIITAVFGPSLLKLFEADSTIARYLDLPYQFTTNFLSVWVVITVSYNYAKSLGIKSPVISSINSLVIFFVIAAPIVMVGENVSAVDKTYLGGTGMFVGFLVVYLVVNIERLCYKYDIRIKMSDIVPQFLQDGFSAIIPLLISVAVFLLVNHGVLVLSNGQYNIPSGFLALIGAPLQAINSFPGMLLLMTFAALLWCFGIHGTIIIFTILMPPIMQAIIKNGELVAAGQAPIFAPVMLSGTVAMVGGTGNTLPIALLGWNSKSEQIKALSRISLLPGWFGINEPLTFGMPIMYNPILCIPYVLSVPVIMTLTYIAYKIGFLMPGWILIMSLLPMGFGGYLSTLNIKNAIWDYLMIIPATIIYNPFFKMYEKQLIKKEQEAKELENA